MKLLSGIRGLVRKEPITYPHLADWERFEAFCEDVAEMVKEMPRCLALEVGAGEGGRGVQAIRTLSNVCLVDSDIYLSAGRTLLCDAERLPFADSTFDLVIANGVLEHVIDPYLSVAEMHRVLQPNGLVLAQMPFMQGVHMPDADFTRWSYGGFLALFRKFRPLKLEMIRGPGASLAYAIAYFAFAWCNSDRQAEKVKSLINWPIFWISKLDKRLMDKPGSYDLAERFAYLGIKDGTELSHQEIISRFKGRGMDAW